MNVFEPYESKSARHEDALTRAFLLVLRSVPVAHGAWLHLVDRAHRANGGLGVPSLHELAAPTVEMQTASVSEHVRRLISLVQTDETFVRQSDAGPSERKQRLDGVVTYDQALAIVIENKPSHLDIWEGQLDVNVPPGVEHDPRVACVTWKAIILAWGGLLEAGHLSRSEAVLLGDFLDYVEEHFPRLRPYSKVALCGSDLERLRRRCHMLLATIAPPARVEYHRGWSWFIRADEGQAASQIALDPRRRKAGLALMVELDPGDTTAQARRLFAGCSLPELLALRDRGWSIEPNLHLAHMTRNLLWTHTRLSVAAYWAFWSTRLDWIRQWRREEFETLFATLEAEGLATEQDRPELAKHVLGTARATVNLCPGLTMRWWLPVEDAALLDARGTLEETVRTAIEAGAGALRLALPR